MENSNEITSEVIIDASDKYKNIDVITDHTFDGKTDVTLKDINYLCKFTRNYEGCENCLLNNGRICPYALLIKQFKGYENLNISILSWLNDNPPTSYLMDIKVKMPTIQIDDTYNIPLMCVQSLYGKDCKCNLSDPSKFDCSKLECRECWRQPMKEFSDSEE